MKPQPKPRRTPPKPRRRRSNLLAQPGRERGEAEIHKLNFRPWCHLQRKLATVTKQKLSHFSASVLPPEFQQDPKRTRRGQFEQPSIKPEANEQNDGPRAAARSQIIQVRDRSST